MEFVYVLENRGTRRKKFVDMLPLFIQTWIIRNSRGATKWSHSLLGKFWHHLRPGHRQPRGLQKQQRQDPPEWAPPLEEEDEKPKIDGPTKGISHKVLANKQQSTER
jgi:hypothetical protein